MIVKCDRYGRIALSHFLELIDIRKIKKYSIRQNKDKTITIKFYDKQDKLVKPYAKK